jgi:hypothetical protein
LSKYYLLTIFCFAASLNAEADTYSRHSVLAFSVTGYAALRDVRSFLDVGIEKIKEEGGHRCEILHPLPTTKAARQPWAPFDFYTNILTAKEQKAAAKEGTLGEPNIFFAGDENNRNNEGHSHKWTRQVADNFRLSLDFIKGPKVKNWFSFVIEFTRGKIFNQRLVSTRAFLDSKGECRAIIYDCSAITIARDGSLSCTEDGWTRAILQVQAVASTSGALSDYYRGVKNEKSKNDVSKVLIELDNLDKKGMPEGSPYIHEVLPST